MHKRRVSFITYIIDLFRRDGRGELEEDNMRDSHIGRCVYFEGRIVMLEGTDEGLRRSEVTYVG